MLFSLHQRSSVLRSMVSGLEKILLKPLRFEWDISHSGFLHDQSLILVCFIQHQKSSICAEGANQVMLLSRNKLELQFALEPESWFGHGRNLKYGLSSPKQESWFGYGLFKDVPGFWKYLVSFTSHVHLYLGSGFTDTL